MNELKLLVVVVLIVFYFGVNFIPSIPARRVMRLIMAIVFLSYEILASAPTYLLIIAGLVVIVTISDFFWKFMDKKQEPLKTK